MNQLNELHQDVEKIMKNDPAHDFDHIMRVYKNAEKLCRKEKVKPKLVLTAALLHDIVSYAKSDKRSKNASTESAKKAKTMLKKHGYSNDEIVIITDAIRDHSFSKQKTPETIEGKILQDADRLDAIGAIGIARAFSVAGSEKRLFYNKDDPFCKTHPPNDKQWTLDHFYRKLLKLESLMNTKSAKIEAKRRTKILKTYLNDLKKEIT